MKVKIFGKECDYQPTSDEMTREVIMNKLQNNSSFRKVFKNNITDKFINSMKKIVDPNYRQEDNFILSISGKSGTGKSTTALSLGKIIIPERFNYKHMCFFNNEIKELNKTLPRDSLIIRDEGTDKATFGVGSIQESSELKLIVESSRKKGLSIIFIEPTEKRDDIVKYYLETVDRDTNQRISRLAVKEPDSMQYLGAIYVPVVSEYDYDLIKYNIKKDKYLEDLQQGKMNGAKMNPKEIAMKFYKKINLDLFKKPKERKAFVTSKYPQYTTGQIDSICTWLEMLIRNDGEIEDV